MKLKPIVHYIYTFAIKTKNAVINLRTLKNFMTEVFMYTKD